ncbi:phosphotransferase family protein [Halovivax sp.]|uniref:phosphotransferase family protein n=1 Tax=Halovivax sp. TaxID=1935978 RepID=UPI0025BD8433|nr:phosphotransferase family protein [Halovivax sp.]
MTRTDGDLDAADLDAFLSAELNRAVAGTEVLHDGLNLSLGIRLVGDAAPAYVLRRPNKLRGEESFLEVRREYEVLRRLRETAVPAPDPVFVCEDESVVGDPFLVTTHLDGVAVPLGDDLPERFRTSSAREVVATSLIDALAEVHSVDADRFADVCRRESTEEQLERVLGQLEAATGATGREPPAIWKVADWLRDNVPTSAETSLVHGDYRPANVLLAGGDRPEVAGVLDWETAFLGDPRTELGYFLLRWRDDGDPTPPLDGLRERYGDEGAIGELGATNERGLAPFTGDPGSPSRRELVARYEERTGIEFENERFYRALAAITLATIWEQLHRHRLDAGLESEREPYVDYVAMMAEQIVDGAFEL